MKVITIAAPKGGVTKTTTAAHIAAALTRYMEPAILIDLDPQGSAAVTLGLTPDRDTYNWLDGQRLEDCLAWTGRADLHILRAGRILARIPMIAAAEQWPASRIRQRLDEDDAATLADWIVIDTPPAAGWMQEAALAAADLVVIPAALDALGLGAVPAALRTIQALGIDPEIVILPTMYERQTVTRREALAGLIERYGDRYTVEQPIQARAAMRAAQAAGKLAWEHDRDMDTGAQYIALTARIRAALNK